ncbi:hypothetical protein ACFOOL_04340 [Devosia honganensis]|uniref:EF-hand domain-containing protein n=1 Tax=Devosia honganensis TaxID=1610527 RepID=A0ABV7WYR1_9HYPH
MNKFVLGFAALALAATPALAQTPLTFADVDIDGSGELSFVELQAVWPDLSQEEFDAADLDLSGGLNPDELNALQPSTLPAPAPTDDGGTSLDAPAESLTD